MRYVDIGDLELPTGWHEQAQAATRALVEDDAEIDDFKALWRDLRGELAKLLGGKCWFCETPVPRSDNPIDHFRPKGRVSDALQDHRGYRWLCFEPHNFRYACTFCNRRIDLEHGTAGGKADRFPLLNEDERVYSVNPAAVDYDDLIRATDAELPAILDPCNPDDWLLLGCKRENGRPCATSDDPRVVRRVETSIEVFHLHHEPTCKQRHTVAGQFTEAVQAAKDDFLNSDAQQPRTEAKFTRSLERVKRMLKRKAPYSGEMRFVLMGLRSPRHPWIGRLLGDPD